MTLEDVLRLAAQGESGTLELKKSTAQLDRAGETLCAFLNGQGGAVLIGVADNGTPVGQQVSDKTLQDVAGLLRRFEPPASVSVERIGLGGAGKEVLALVAGPQSAAPPFTFAGRPYQRVGSTTSVMPQPRYQALLLERAHGSNRWENAPALGGGLGTLDTEEILRTVRLGIAAGRLPEATGSDPADILDRLSLRVGFQLTNAALVLFGTSFLPYFPQCTVRLARFKGIDKTAFLDNRQATGHAFKLLEEAMLFLERHLPISGEIPADRLERVDTPLFPIPALREALVNAICHRDYTIAGGAVSVAVFDDRLEIWSDGTLPFGLRPEDLKREHPSRPRNPLIAGVFYRRGLVEQWGRGTQKIVELCVRAGHPEPEFFEQAGSVVVRFLPRGYVAPHRVSHDLTERQREILQVLAVAGAISLSGLRVQLVSPPSDRTLQLDLAHLRRLGLVESGGRGRGAWYRLRRATSE